MLAAALLYPYPALVWSDDPAGAPLPAAAFQKHVIDADFANGYQVSTADLDSDGDPDVIALSTQPSQLVWYRNPDWERVSISTRTQRNIDCAPYDIDGDGDPDLAVASDFDLGDSRRGGTLQWLECPGDPDTQQEWEVHPIDAIPTSHRVRWADIDGDGRKELVNLPIVGVGSEPPDYAVGVQFRAYRVPGHPTSDPWMPVPLDDSLRVAHGLRVVDWNSDGRAGLLTASFEGVHLFQWSDGRMVRQQIGVGFTGPGPKQGSSEVALGRLRTGPPRFVATIEPWHGNEVVVYVGTDSDTLPWPRTVIDNSLTDGHGLVCLDVDGDGSDEIVAGGRGGAHEVILYRWRGNGAGWERHTIDPSGVAVAGLTVADINQDGRPDLVAAGTATHDVVWYENRTGKRLPVLPIVPAGGQRNRSIDLNLEMPRVAGLNSVPATSRLNTREKTHQ